MKHTIKHRGRVVGGKKLYDNPFLYKQQLQELEGKNFVEIIEEVHKKPSVDQHKFYRGGILGTCSQTEYFAHFPNNDKIHEFFADMFLSYTEQVVTPDKSYIRQKVRSTADLSKKEYSEFIEKVIAWCETEAGITVGDAEQYHSRYYKTIKTK